jgi:hypothetical protein
MADPRGRTLGRYVVEAAVEIDEKAWACGIHEMTSLTLLLAEFAMANDLSSEDVLRMTELGLVNLVDTMAGKILLWPLELSPAECKAAYRVVLRIQGKKREWSNVELSLDGKKVAVDKLTARFH